MLSKIGIIGVGLIGGSIGLAIKRYLPQCHVVGFGQHIERLNRAVDCNAVDSITQSLETGLSDCDLIVVCTPVGDVVDYVSRLQSIIPPRTLITDVGSTKQMICRTLAVSHSSSFLGSHPISGSEKSGVEAASATLFDQKTVILTPVENTPRQLVTQLSVFWESLGAKVTCLTPEEHDLMLARTSHLPHLLSVALALASHVEADRDFFGTGFQSVGRLSGGNPNVWADICSTNRDAILDALDHFEQTFHLLRKAIAENDGKATLQLLQHAKQQHDHFVD